MNNKRSLQCCITNGR